MAYVNAQLPPEQQNQFAQPGLTTPNPLGLLPPQAGGSAGTGTGGSAPSGQATTTQFAAPASKLSDYLAANQDQTQALGGKIAGDLTTQYGQTTGAVDQAGQTFGQQVSAGYTPYNPDVVNQAAANPTQFAAKPENVSAFQSQWNDQYTGPTNFESSKPYSDVQNQVQSAVQNANLVGTQSGLSTYLGNTAKGTYTPGMQTLDTALVAGNAPAYKQITDAAKPYAGLNQYLTDATSKADALVPGAQTDAAKAAQYAKDTFTGPTGVVPTFSNAINTGAATAEKGRNDYNNSLNQFYSNAVPVAQRIDQWAGTIPNGVGGQYVHNLVDPILTANQPMNNPISAANYANTDQYAEAKALQQLIGGDLNLPISQDTAGLAGTAQTAPDASVFPSLQQLGKQYATPVAMAYGNDPRLRNGSGWGPDQAAATQSARGLVDYLMGIDPDNYFDAQPSTDPLGPGAWGFKP